MKILGIDYGRKKIGLAVGDDKTKLVSPLKVLSIADCRLQIADLIEENQIKKIIIGLPTGRLDEEVIKFGEKLGEQTSLPVKYFEETLSTQDAQKILLENRRTRKRRQKLEDAIAAAVMLQFYLEGGLC